MADRRALRTEGYLKEALIGILREKPLEKTTLKEVLERAGVSKKAFYAHYKDIIDLAISCYLWPTWDWRVAPQNHPLRSARDVRTLYGYILGRIVDQLRFSRENPNLARAVLFNVGRSPYFDRAVLDGGVTYLTNFAVDSAELAGGYGGGLEGGALTPDICARYIFGGSTALKLDWLRRGMLDDEQTVAKRALMLNLQCISLLTGESVSHDTIEFIRDWTYEPGNDAGKAADGTVGGEGVIAAG